MSQKLLVSDLQNSRVPASLGICPTDERFYQWLNEAENLMLGQGRWYGSVQEAQFCVESGCITWPRQVATVEQIQVCGHPIPVEGPWYPFTRLVGGMHSCPGCSSSGSNLPGRCGGRRLCDHLRMEVRAATVPTFATTRGTNKVIRSYPTNSADVGKKLIFQGRDTNGIWVRTNIGGAIADGEQVTLALPFVDTVTVWGPGSPQAVIKDATSYRVLVYEYDTVAATERQLAEYEPGETRPDYRVGYIHGMRGNGGCGGCTGDSDDARTTVTALVSLQHIDVVGPDDWLILRNLSAYKAAMMAVKAWEEGDAARGNFYFYGTESAPKNGRGALRVVNRGGAIPLLQAELRKNTSDRVTAAIYTDESDKFARITAGFR